MTAENASKHYDATYFEWQRKIGEFGGAANAFKFRRSVKPSDKVIDFGCGGGFLLANLDCAEKVGLEVNQNAHEQIAENGARAFMTPADGLAELGDGWADVIISNHALEHTLHPLMELQALMPLLKPGGRIHFVVPSETIAFRWKPNDANFHLYTWSPMNLGNLFVQAGYEVEEAKPYIHKWPKRHRQIQRIFGWKIFNMLCRLNGQIRRSWFQVEIVARKPLQSV